MVDSEIIDAESAGAKAISARGHSAWKGASSVNITDCSNKLPAYWRVIDSLRSCLSAPVRWRFPKD